MALISADHSIVIIGGGSAGISVTHSGRPRRSVASIRDNTDKSTEDIHDDLMHVVPPQAAPDWNKAIDLAAADATGYVEIDKLRPILARGAPRANYRTMPPSSANTGRYKHVRHPIYSMRASIGQAVAGAEMPSCRTCRHHHPKTIIERRTPTEMCRAVSCKTCGKTTWAGTVKGSAMSSSSVGADSDHALITRVNAIQVTLTPWKSAPNLRSVKAASESLPNARGFADDAQMHVDVIRAAVETC